MAGTYTFVGRLPPCDFGSRPSFTTGTAPGCAYGPARFDFKPYRGPWGNGCAVHFDAFGTRLGVGFGQLLCTPGETPEVVLSELTGLYSGETVGGLKRATLANGGRI